jgi:hypothetical protein
MLGLLFWWRSKDPRAPPFRDILIDIRNRLPHYRDDWAQIREWKLWCVTHSMPLDGLHANVASMHIRMSAARTLHTQDPGASHLRVLHVHPARHRLRGAAGAEH